MRCTLLMQNQHIKKSHGIFERGLGGMYLLFKKNPKNLWISVHCKIGVLKIHFVSITSIHV